MRLNYFGHKSKAMLLLMWGQKLKALETFDRMLQIWPEDTYALTSRAHLRAQHGDSPGALADYRRLTSRPDANAAHWFNQGFLLESNGQLESAETSFQQALALDAQLDRAWFGLGLVLAKQGRLDEAITALERNTQLQPMSPHAWYELARIHERRSEPEEVARIIRHLQGFEPSVAARLRRETGMGPSAPAT
jgi:tetratricopeptide (TPR) repeat protein